MANNQPSPPTTTAIKRGTRYFTILKYVFLLYLVYTVLSVVMNWNSYRTAVIVPAAVAFFLWKPAPFGWLFLIAHFAFAGITDLGPAINGSGLIGQAQFIGWDTPYDEALLRAKHGVLAIGSLLTAWYLAKRKQFFVPIGTRFLWIRGIGAVVIALVIADLPLALAERALDRNWGPRDMEIYRKALGGAKRAALSLPDLKRSAATDLSKVYQAAIILDLNGNGVETAGVNDGAYFDHDANGFAEKTGWVARNDGLLVLDRNGNGAIDTGRELFGNETRLANGIKAANGFQALAELDDNADGKIDVSDAAYTQLRVWRDGNGDGISRPEELKTLFELNIASIETGYTTSRYIDPHGHAHKHTGTFTRVDNTNGSTADVWLTTDKAFTIATNWLDVPADIAALPDAQGFGNVYDLHQAMVRDTSGTLTSLVQAFTTQTDPAARTATVDQLLYTWTGGVSLAPNSRGSFVDARKMAAMEAFYGQAYVGQTNDYWPNASNPHSLAAPSLEASYQGIRELVYAQLMAQTHLKDLYPLIRYRWDKSTQSLNGNLSAVITELQAQLTNNPIEGKLLLTEFARTIHGFQADEMMDFSGFRKAFPAHSKELADKVGAKGLEPLSVFHRGCDQSRRPTKVITPNVC